LYVFQAAHNYKRALYRAASTHLLIYELTQRWGW